MTHDQIIRRQKVLLLGGSGFIGTEFCKFLSAAQIPHQAISRSQCDYTLPAQLDDLVRSSKPTFLINAAGYTGRPNVDGCELHKTECLWSNTVLPGLIRDVCERYDIPWGHLSSGCIYTGSTADNQGFRETDVPNFSFRQNNCSFYSGSKALAEELLAGVRQCYIWRLRMPFSERDHSRNYLSKLMRYDRLLDARNSLSHLGDAVAACWACVKRGVEFGTYNITNPGALTTREIVEQIRCAGICRKQFKFFQSEDEFLRLAVTTPRSNCVLNTEKAEAAGIAPRHVTEAIADALARWVSNP